MTLAERVLGLLHIALNTLVTIVYNGRFLAVSLIVLDVSAFGHFAPRQWKYRTFKEIHKHYTIVFILI